jgi:hypothetical protein
MARLEFLRKRLPFHETSGLIHSSCKAGFLPLLNDCANQADRFKNDAGKEKKGPKQKGQRQTSFHGLSLVRHEWGLRRFVEEESTPVPLFPYHRHLVPGHVSLFSRAVLATVLTPGCGRDIPGKANATMEIGSLNLCR